MTVVLTLVEILLQLLKSPIAEEIQSVCCYKSQLHKLKSTMSTIRALLLDAEQQVRQQLQLSHTLQDKLERLKEAVYQGDDLFDEIATLAQRKKLMPGNNAKKEVQLFFSRFNQLLSAFKMCRESRKIREILDDIARDHHDFGAMHHVALEANLVRMRNNPRETHSYICEEDVIIGRERDKRIVKDIILDTSLEEDVSFISIVGIGGLGKTTLAQLVYNDESIMREFPLKIWVYVSHDFNVKALLGEILAVVTNKQSDLGGLTMDALQRNLRQELDGKKYLLVLDDIWNEDWEEWRKMRNLLIRGGRGSRVIVTTRSREVAKIVGSHLIYELEALSDEDSWNLFERMTLESGQHQIEREYVDVAKEIVRKCANNPLALRVIGSLFRGQGESRWRYVKNTDLLANSIPDKINGIIPVLKISYIYLPFYLKRCFSYCAIFPKNHKIIKDDLIGFWMAQGFIMPLDGESFEDAGEEYFMNLLQRCFFQNVERADSGEIISCKMHDLIHDVAKEVASNEIYNASYFTKKTRHAFLDNADQSKTMCRNFTKMKRLRTYLWTSSCPTSSSFDWLLKMRYLRVLKLYCSVKLSSVIGELMHLRYLDLSNNNLLSTLPLSITQLYNLQTLKLRYCRSLKQLPKDFSKLVNLRHLDIFNCWSLTHMPLGLSSMTCLHKLTRFVVGEANYAGCWIGDLKHLNNLRGAMEIKVNRGCSCNVIDQVSDGGYMINKPNLRELNIYWDPYDEEDYASDDESGGDNAKALLQALQPHPNLKMLRLFYYPEVRFPSWWGSSMKLEMCLPNLVEIQLGKCRRLKHLPLMSQLRNLKFLRIDCVRELKYMESTSHNSSSSNRNNSSSSISRSNSSNSRDGDELVFFPSLELLELEDLPKLKGWWELPLSHSYSFPRLSTMRIEKCPHMTTFPLCPKLEELVLWNVNGALGPIMTRSSTDVLASSSSWGTLRTVKINNVRSLDSLPMESMQRLSYLEIKDDHNFERLTTGNVLQNSHMCALQSPVVSLQRAMWEHFTALKTLKLSNLSNLELNDDDTYADMPWRCLAHNLFSLELRYLPKLVKLPRGMHHLNALHSLQISHCDHFQELPTWINCLSSLYSLQVLNCSGFEVLPEEIRHLTSLRELNLRHCSSELKDRCQKPAGVDWPKIQHIPLIDI